VDIPNFDGLYLLWPWQAEIMSSIFSGIQASARAIVPRPTFMLSPSIDFTFG
jgi:hypothetical protein